MRNALFFMLLGAALAALGYLAPAFVDYRAMMRPRRKVLRLARYRLGEGA